MSLGIVVKGPEGLVLAAESRVTISPNVSGVGVVHVGYDNATKVLNFEGKHSYIGVVTYGLGSIGMRTAHSYLPEFESSLTETRLPVEHFAKKMSDFFKAQWEAERGSIPYTGPSMVFHVAGFTEGKPYGEVFTFEIPANPVPRRVDREDKGFECGIWWGGQREFVDRIIMGVDPALLMLLRSPDFKLTTEQAQKLDGFLPGMQMQIPLQAMALQDDVDLAAFLLRTTISGQQVGCGLRGCGGPMDIATITRRDGLQFIQRKTIRVT